MNAAVKKERVSLEFYLNQAQLLTKENKVQDAISLYKKAIEVYPRHFRLHYELGQLLKKSQSFAEAISSYQKTISLNPQWFKPYYDLGQIAVEQNNLELAIDYYQQAINLKSDYTWVYFDFGNIYEKLNKLELAVNSYQQLIKLNINFYLAWFRLGEIFRKQDSLEEAISNYRQALTLKPNDVKTFQRLQICLAQQSPEKYPDYQAYKLALVDNTKDEKFYYQLGKKLSKQGLIETAIDCYLKVVEINPQFTTVYETIYNSILYLDNCDRIIEVYQKTLSKYPNLLTVKKNLGKMFSRQGNIELAIRYNQQIAQAKTKSKFPNLSNKKCLREPSFLIIGSEKCGTSSLYQYIIKHPQVISAIEKEIHFFTYNFAQGLDWYLSHFSPLPQGSGYITGEASTSYIACHDNAPQRVVELFPNIKLLSVIRDPIKRVISHYNQLVRLGKENRSLEEVIQIELDILRNVDDIWAIKQTYWSQAKGVLWHSLYVYFLRQWLNVFPREQLLILRSEDLFAKTQETMSQVFNFLELDKFSQQSYQTYNSGGKYNQLPEFLVQELQDFFEPHNRKLEELIVS